DAELEQQREVLEEKDLAAMAETKKSEGAESSGWGAQLLPRLQLERLKSNFNTPQILWCYVRRTYSTLFQTWSAHALSLRVTSLLSVGSGAPCSREMAADDDLEVLDDWLDDTVPQEPWQPEFPADQGCHRV
ncbi:unnamed protein product, partial [Symbiodinium microadriaticum]